MKHDFQSWGRRGGLKRARGLSASLRAQIAFKAAQARWGKTSNHSEKILSVRLSSADLTQPVFLEELLSTGSVEEWKCLYQEIFNFPFGPVAEALERVLSVSKIYGVTALWKSLLMEVQGRR